LCLRVLKVKDISLLGRAVLFEKDCR
jgi:hypothetical protein